MPVLSLILDEDVTYSTMEVYFFYDGHIFNSHTSFVCLAGGEELN